MTMQTVGDSDDYEEEQRVGNLLQTAEHYGIDRKTLRATVARYPKFPRRKVGGTKHGWELDWDEIDEWLKKNSWYRGRRAPSMRSRINRGDDPNELPLDIQKIRKGILAKDTKEDIQTKLLRLEYDKKRGVLVERAEIVGSMAIIVARLAKQLELMPNLIGKKTGATDEQIRMWRDVMDQARNAFVNDADPILNAEVMDTEEEEFIEDTEEESDVG